MIAVNSNGFDQTYMHAFNSNKTENGIRCRRRLLCLRKWFLPIRVQYTAFSFSFHPLVLIVCLSAAYSSYKRTVTLDCSLGSRDTPSSYYTLNAILKLALSIVSLYVFVFVCFFFNLSKKKPNRTEKKKTTSVRIHILFYFVS